MPEKRQGFKGFDGEQLLFLCKKLPGFGRRLICVSPHNHTMHPHQSEKEGVIREIWQTHLWKN